MNTVWSEHVQGVMTLYLSRKLRHVEPTAFWRGQDGAFRDGRRLTGGAWLPPAQALYEC